jgi:hypothetical protein
MQPKIFKLGKLPPKHDPRTLCFAKYLKTGSLPVAPDVLDSWTQKISTFPMYLNDKLGDCGIAGMGHLIETWTACSGTEFSPTDDDILTAYAAISGYDPVTGDNDNGINLLDGLNYWKATGVASHKIDSFMSVEAQNDDHLREAMYLFGSAYVGVQLPISAQGQDIWTVPTGGPRGDGTPGSWGGHCIQLIAYDSDFVTCVTWGSLKKMTWAWWNTYGDEAWAIISPDWVSSNTNAPNRFNYAELQSDLQAIVA